MRTASVFGRYCFELVMVKHKSIPKYYEQARIEVGQKNCQVQNTPWSVLSHNSPIIYRDFYGQHSHPGRRLAASDPASNDVG